jgi:hypothetical protein
VRRRVYRTGDLARRDGDDAPLVFHGRRDDQMKIRGARVEPREVERVLCRQPGVAEAAVGVQDAGTTQARLVGYLVAEGDLAVEDVHDALCDVLPSYMLPAQYVIVGQLPRTHSGKVDRDALRAAPPTGATVHRTPHTDTECGLAEIWSEVLGQPVDNCAANFFMLGGHSLLVPLLTARVSERYAVDLPIVAVFHRPTLCGLASAIDEQAGHPER